MKTVILAAALALSACAHTSTTHETSNSQAGSSPDGGAGNANTGLASGSASAADSAGASASGASSSAAAPATGGSSTLDYRKDGSNYILVLKKGQKVMASLIDFAQREHINGANFNAIGAVQNYEIGRYNMKTKSYDKKKFSESGEIVALSGSIGRFQEKPIVHAHIGVAGPGLSVNGGHVFEAETSMVVEFFIYPTQTKIIRHDSPDFPTVKTIIDGITQ